LGHYFYFVARRSDEITTVIDLSDRVEAKLRGIQCYTTQVGRQNRFADTPDEVMREPWFQSEHFIRRARRWAGRKG
jgi:LmbE family N-acetylglucosaminyl deacetylase